MSWRHRSPPPLPSPPSPSPLRPPPPRRVSWPFLPVLNKKWEGKTLTRSAVKQGHVCQNVRRANRQSVAWRKDGRVDRFKFEREWTQISGNFRSYPLFSNNAFSARFFYPAQRPFHNIITKKAWMTAPSARCRWQVRRWKTPRGLFGTEKGLDGWEQYYLRIKKVSTCNISSFIDVKMNINQLRIHGFLILASLTESLPPFICEAVCRASLSTLEGWRSRPFYGFSWSFLLQLLNL